MASMLASMLLCLVSLPAVGASTSTSDPQVRPIHAANHVLVKLEPGSQAQQVLGFRSRPLFGSWRVQPVPPGRSAEDTVADLLDRPGVDAVELDYTMGIDPISDVIALDHAASIAVDDPYTSYQWHFPAVQLADAWADSTGDGVVVAVIDTGVAIGGEDLDCHSFVDPYNAITQTQSAAAATDDNGHGTHVAGTIAQCTDNGLGVAGVAFDASLMPIKVLDSLGNGYTSWIAHGIDWAREHGADVVNLSLGCSGCKSQALDDAIEAAATDGIVVVAAAGNDGSTVVSYPANHPDVIAVGATDFNNQVAPYSNRGSALDLVAPGGDTDQDANGDGFGDGVLQETFVSGMWNYYFFDGTSMATPHVAGGAALLKSIAPKLDGAGVENILESTALDLGSLGFDTTYGSGLIQLHDSIEFLLEPDASPPVWPGGADLEAELVLGTKISLAWPHAIDNKALAGYRLYRDGVLVEKIGAPQTTTVVSNLASFTEYEFSVRAEDLTGNLSTALAVEVKTEDIAAPKWTGSAELSVKSYGERELTVQWSGAGDDVGVTEYRLRLAGTTGTLTSAPQAIVTGLQPGTQYAFEVLARDAAGNWSQPLAATVRTARAFSDTSGHTFYDDILWMSGEDVTRGCNPPTNDLFCPDHPVTRGQMAAFIVRALGLNANDHPGFEDVPSTSTFADDIGKLATAGITRGCNPPVNDRFCPDDSVTRAQMAAFVVRALGLAADDHSGFADVSEGSTFAVDIGKLASSGITRGCNPPVNDRFCPDEPITRGQLAAFLHRALD